MKLLLIVLIVGLAGCTHYRKPGGSVADFEREYYECQRDSAPVADPFRRAMMEDRCLKSKGWRQ